MRSAHALPIAAHPAPPAVAVEATPLFRPGFPMDNILCLPFVSDQPDDEQSRNFLWSCPQSRNYTEDCFQGTLFAAAYLLYLRFNGPDALPLGWIAEDMPHTTDSGFAVGFWLHLTQYLGKAVPKDLMWRIEGEARESIARDRETLRQSDEE